MSLTASVTAQIRHKVAEVHPKSKRRPQVIGIKTPGRWQGGAIDEINGQQYRFVQCDSALQVRAAMVDFASEETPLVVVTDLDEATLGADTLARLALGELHTLNPWKILATLFQATRIDPQLLDKRWLAEILLDDVPPEGFAPVPNNFLDAETVWSIVLRRQFNLAQARPDAGDLLTWSLYAANLARFAAAPPELQDAAQRWINQSAGLTGEIIFETVRAGYGQDATAIGIVCEVLLTDDSSAEAREAAARLERLTGGKTLTADTGARWFAHAARTLEQMLRGHFEEEGPRLSALMLRRVDEILVEIRAVSLAHLSRYSPEGFERRLQAFGESLRQLIVAIGAVTSGAGKAQELSARLDETIECAHVALEHQQASHAAERGVGLAMAVRLARWLVEAPPHEATSFAEAANLYARDGGFVDWARHRLHAGEKIESLARSYSQLIEMVTARREKENEQFGHLLAQWTAENSGAENAELLSNAGGAVLRVEEVLQKVLARVGRDVPALFVVMDGMSWAVFRELIESITKAGWIEWGTNDKHLPCPLVAALPSLTEVSRASLLSGQLVAGVSDTEARNFKKHSDLVRVSKSQCPPVLFHKGGLTDTGAADLARPVREAIASEDQRIVGVVINGVDDHLAKGEQINVPWVLPSLPLLKVLMETAATANRFVIITSDHGHVIERQTVYRKGEHSERYRHDDGRPLADELTLAGARVMLPANKRHIASWSERVRYCQPKKHGYHGGITPQECLVPLAILSRPDQSIGNWRELPLYRPLWWEIAPRLSSESKARRTHATGANNPKGSSRKSHPQDALPLFTTETIRAESGAWIDALLDSPAFAAQSKLVGCKASLHDLVRPFLLALDERDGTLTTASLAQRLEQPEMRVEETIEAMRRLLNVEGYDALSIDETRRIVILDRELLRFVFELAG